MSRALYALGHFAARRPWLVIGVWAGALVLVLGASSLFGRDLSDSLEVPGLDSQQAIDLLSEAESVQAGLAARVVLTPESEDVTFFDSAAARTALAEAEEAFRALPGVVGSTDPARSLAAGFEDAVATGSVSPDGRVAILDLQYPAADQVTGQVLTDLEDLRAELNDASPLQIEAGGELFFVFGGDAPAASELVGLAAAVIVLLVAFGSLVAMGLPIGMALFGLALGAGSMSLVTYLVEIPSFAPEMAVMIGLGVGIDYALFLVTRHREFLGRGMGVAEAAGQALATSGLAVVFAGGTVVIAILGLAVAGIPFMTAAGVATSIIVGIMVIASITLLPAFLGVVGHRIDRRLFHPIGSIEASDVTPRWRRWGSHVARHAWVYVVAVTVALVALAAPVMSLRLGWPDDGTLPVSRTERRAYDLVADSFGPGTNGPFLIAVDLAGDVDVLESLEAAVAADAGIVALAPPLVSTDGRVATMIAVPTTSPQDPATVATVERLRSEVLPSVLDGSAATAHVGGTTASFADMGDQVSRRLPWFVVAVVAMSLILLTMVFRSVLVPLKAAVLNLLSIGAAYGVLVMVFQWGWGASLIGVESTLPVVSFIPLFMFAVLFGLSMDYEVFLLSRIREEYHRTGDNDEAVIAGIAGTARVISSAALIMITVFLAFVLDPDPLTKMVGLGLATAIAVDATVVRLILVPATMTLMGKANWWLPGWLDRILPRIDIDHAEAPPELVPEPAAAA